MSHSSGRPGRSTVCFGRCVGVRRGVITDDRLERQNRVLDAVF